MMKLSIIIPIYNLEKYLGKCLDSIVCQNCTDIEIILVNDGSVDNSGKIADDYANYHPFISVIHQKNQGVSAARNNGLSKARGEYVWFIDGDDWINEKAIKEIIPLCAKGADIIFIGKIDVINGAYLTPPHQHKSILTPNSIEDYFLHLLSQNITYYPWDKVVKRQLLIDNNLIFNEKYTVGEDYFWNIGLLSHAQIFLLISDTLYFYRKFRSGSATEQISESRTKKSIEVLKDSIYYINKAGNSPYKKQSLLLFSSKVWFGIYPDLITINPKDILHYKNIMHEVYQTYNQQGLVDELKIYNRGAKLLHKIVGIFGWHYGYSIYGYLINIRRSKFGFWLLNKFGG